MTEFDKADIDGDGVVTKEEMDIYLEDKRRRMEDDDAQRDAIRKMAWFSLIGLLLYPFGIFLTDMFGLDQAAKLIADIAPTYFASIAVLYFLYLRVSQMEHIYLDFLYRNF